MMLIHHYDLLGHPTRIQFSNFNVVEYVYTADGRRLKTIHRKAVPHPQSLLMGNTHTLTASETQSVDSTEYIGSFVFENNAFKLYHFEGGYITPSTSKYYVKDHLGNNRILASCTGTVEQTTHYYPYGAIHHFSTNQGVQKYKYNGKELDTMHGLNWYDYGARQYDPAIGQFTTVDPLCEKYYHISPYAYCGGNPVNRVDVNGDSVAILNLGGMIGHSAILIQDENNQWAYYSMNGTSIYKATSGLAGGKPVHDIGTKKFKSPEDFLNSNYNQKATSEDDIRNNSVNNYGFTEAYIIPTTKEQDIEAAKFFKERTNSSYDLLFNNCAEVVSMTLDHIGITTYVMNYDGHRYYKDYPIMPFSLFINVVLNYPDQKILKR